MHIVLGISATSDEVTAALVDVELPRLGPVDERTIPMQTGSPAEVAAAVATSIGVMRLRAARADLLLTGAAVVLESPHLREPVESALRDGHVRDVVVVDAVDVDPSLEPAVAVALWADHDAGDAITGPIPVVLPEPVDASSRETRRGFAVVGAGVAAAVLAGSFAVWAVTGPRAPEAAGVAEPLSTSATDSAEAGTGIAPNPAAPAGSSSTAVPAPVPGGTTAADALTGIRPGVTQPNGAVSVPAAPGAATTRPGTSSAAPSSGASTSGGSSSGGSTTSGSTSGGSTSGGSTSGGSTGGGSTSGGSTGGGSTSGGGTGTGGTDPGTGTGGGSGGDETPGSTGGSSSEPPTDSEPPSQPSEPDPTPDTSGTASVE
ncbi:hypothetical protein HQ305_13750 [Rhodococcus sp. BP-149]|uniref:hypothetical protein n=1 Tax=unclassified Rhodococcus (in: high G+C Gram-positive bacteria) TaxID=192944 RepID=UPI001C9B85B1|nr:MULTISPECIES: hypothetical protein [unclassified Rhodococcus (in: high G+C Gram-positive bacteria)]MBY6686623.1 hypothetical protein [Rhodococcus sp. BP-288]MBY6695333.1 hypothetical protein [Rhodococcus sp. BP-188]MBY6700115.1 hypothetical protein [Rhodococcus sp. BP-285]MBY6704862.1 hypothetical protein [Rhodococcus sp. BP-283]MBY6713240.1 hypothetical protein [Rhodococcus sp. BP-160]